MLRIHLLGVVVSRIVFSKIFMLDGVDNYMGIALKERDTAIVTVKSGIGYLDIVASIV